MKLYGKVVAVRLGNEFSDGQERADIKLESGNGATSAVAATPNVLTIPNEGWRLGDTCEINLTIAKAGTPAARTAAARAARAGG